VSIRDEICGARVIMPRRLAWAETDASGHNHFSQAIRWMEEAEHELWRLIGRPLMVPSVPRVHLSVDYRERIWFDDEVDVTVGVVAVGRSSCTFGYEARVAGSGRLAQEGRWTVVYAPDPHGGARPWPDDVRAFLSTGGSGVGSGPDNQT
jgi:acyl-CoA thioester hydrolase